VLLAANPDEHLVLVPLSPGCGHGCPVHFCCTKRTALIPLGLGLLGNDGTCPACPVSRLIPAQTGAKARPCPPTAAEGIVRTDSPLEERGFEPRVPLRTATLFGTPHSARCGCLRVKKVRVTREGDLRFETLSSASNAISTVNCKRASAFSGETGGATDQSANL